MRIQLAVIILAMPVGLLGQKSAVSVPFVGCASSGQVETLEAPKGKDRAIPITRKDAQALAWYESADGIGVLGPRGWFCEGGSGSGGYLLFLSPNPITRDDSGREAAAIAINRISSGASGRWEIAETMMRIFPAYRSFAAGILRGLDFPNPTDPYPNDILKYRSKTLVEFETPAHTKGLGNSNSRLRTNDLPIKGVAILTGDPPDINDGPDLVLLSVRLPSNLARLAPVIIAEVERDTVGVGRK